MELSQHTPPSYRRWLDSEPLKLLLFSIAYFLAAKLSYLYPDSARVMAAIWPASGISLAALLLSQRRRWPLLLVTVGLADLLAKLSVGQSPTIDIGYMIANVAEPGLAAWAITEKIRRPIRMTHIDEILTLIAAAILVNGVTP